MNKKQVEEIAALQRSIFDQVAHNDQSKLRQQLEVMLYWIRKQIFKQVQIIMLDCDDPVKAANLQVADIQLQKGVAELFARYQASMIKYQGPDGDENTRRKGWLTYIKWVEEIINAEVSIRTGKYIKLRPKREK